MEQDQDQTGAWENDGISVETGTDAEGPYVRLVAEDPFYRLTMRSAASVAKFARLLVEQGAEVFPELVSPS